MDFTWIVVGLAGWALALVFVLLLMRMAGQQDRAARHNEKKLDPFSDVTITEVQSPRFTTACGGGNSKSNPPEPAEPSAPSDPPGRERPADPR